MCILVVREEDGMLECPAAKEKLHTYTCNFSTAVPFRTSFSYKE
jgi:hypothetical protein